MIYSGEFLASRTVTEKRCAPPSPYFDHMASFVRIALAGAGSFAKMEIRAGDDISDLAERACAKFSHWGVNAGQISLYLVAAGGDDLPTPSAVDSARHLEQIGWSLSRAGISSGAWLVARKIVDGGATFSCAAVILRVGNSLFSASSGMENVGVSSSRGAAPRESRVLDGRQEHDSNLGDRLPRRLLKFGVDSGECAGGTLKEE